MQDILLSGLLYLGAAVLAVPLAARLGLGSVLGYLVAGVVLGLFPGIGSETEELQHVAEFGVVMMLFLIGLELEPRVLWDMRDRLIGLGGLQIGLTTVVVTGGGIVLGLPWQTALAVGFIFALSSTAIVLQTLSEKGLMQTGGGRSAFSVLLTQDIAVIPLLALLPLLAVSPGVQAGEDGSLHRAVDDHGGGHGGVHGFSLVEGLPGWGVTLVTLAAVGAVILVGVFMTRPVFRYIHQARLREMYTALALLMVFAVAVLMQLVGLSPALGTFLAGVVLANTEFRHELESDLAPFKGLLLGLFFITVGAGIDKSLFLSMPFVLIGLTAALILAKGGVLWLLALLFRIRGRDRWLFTLSLAQAGEFGFVLIAFSTQTYVLDGPLADILLMVVALSMLVTPLLFILYEWLGRRVEVHADEPADEIEEKGEIIIAGIGRFGQVVSRLVESAGFPTTVLDNNLAAVQTMRKFGFKGYFGDPTRPDLLHAAGIDTANVLVVALDDPAAATQLVSYARRLRPGLHIVARARDRVHVFELYQAGADDIVRELFDSSLRAGRYVLEHVGLTEFEANKVEMTFYHHDRQALRELATLWKPGVPVEDNPEYLARSRELRTELEAGLTEALAEEETGPSVPRVRTPGGRSKAGPDGV